MQHTPQPPTPRLASIGSRAGARIIDTLIVAVPLVIVMVAGFGSLFLGISSRSESGAAAGVAGILLAIAAALVVSFLYEVGFVATSGQTPGKRLLHIRVARVEDGGVPGWGRATTRWLIPALFSWPKMPFLPLVPYLWAVFDGHRQGLHDKAARTCVVETVAAVTPTPTASYAQGPTGFTL